MSVWHACACLRGRAEAGATPRKAAVAAMFADAADLVDTAYRFDFTAYSSNLLFQRPNTTAFSRLVPSPPLACKSKWASGVFGSWRRPVFMNTTILADEATCRTCLAANSGSEAACGCLIVDGVGRMALGAAGKRAGRPAAGGTRR